MKSRRDCRVQDEKCLVENYLPPVQASSKKASRDPNARAGCPVALLRWRAQRLIGNS